MTARWREYLDVISDFTKFSLTFDPNQLPIPSVPALSNRGRREDRVRAAPAVSRAICTKKSAHEHTGSAETLRPSPRNGLRLIPCSPRRDQGLFVTVIPKKRELPKELDAPAIGASGPHGFAVRFSRARQSQLSRPPLPASNVRDDRETPLLVGTG